MEIIQKLVDLILGFIDTIKELVKSIREENDKKDD